MAAVPVTIVGILTTDGGSTNATMVGMASLTGLGVGGGPIVPPSDAHPEHPIVLPPDKPSVPPPSIWPPGPGIDFPSHPIVLPPPGNPIAPGTLIEWKAVWTEDKGWFIVGVPNVPHPAPSS